MASAANRSADGLMEPFQIVNRNMAIKEDEDFEFIEVPGETKPANPKRLKSQAEGCNFLAELINTNAAASSVIDVNTAEPSIVFQTVGARQDHRQWCYQVSTPLPVQILTTIIKEGLLSQNYSGYKLTVNQLPEQKMDTLVFGCVLVEKPPEGPQVNNYEVILDFSNRI